MTNKGADTVTPNEQLKTLGLLSSITLAKMLISEREENGCANALLEAEIHDSTRYLMFCDGDGSIVPESEGRYSRHGDFWSNAYIIKQGMEDQFNIDPTEPPSEAAAV